VNTVACLTHAKKLACYCAVFAYGSPDMSANFPGFPSPA
jgi:hypothetical protein